MSEEIENKDFVTLKFPSGFEVEMGSTKYTAKELLELAFEKYKEFVKDKGGTNGKAKSYTG